MDVRNLVKAVPDTPGEYAESRLWHFGHCTDVWRDVETGKTYKARTITGLSDKDLEETLKKVAEKETRPPIIGTTPGNFRGNKRVFVEYDLSDVVKEVSKILIEANRIMEGDA